MGAPGAGCQPGAQDTILPHIRLDVFRVGCAHVDFDRLLS